jgi:hypothetical protein
MRPHPGGDHVHLIRNEGNIVAATIAVQFIPAGSRVGLKLQTRELPLLTRTD